MAKITKVVAIIGLLSLAGCASTPVVDTQIVKVPVLSCPAPKETVRPVLPIDSLNKDDNKDPGKVVSAYKATVKALQGYIDELEKQLGGYKDLSETPAKTQTP